MLAFLGLRLRQHCEFLTLAFFVKNFFFEKELIKTNDCPQCQIIKLSRNVYLEKIRSVLQQTMLSLTDLTLLIDTMIYYG
jgi:hypothetical protein